MAKKEPGIINGEVATLAGVAELRSFIEATAANTKLYEEKHFNKRTDAIDFIGFQVMEEIEVLLAVTPQAHELAMLKIRAEKIRSTLEEIDNGLFKKIRAGIRSGRCTGAAFKSLVAEYVGFDDDHEEHLEEAGYDNLDVFINGLFSSRAMPGQSKELEPEMVSYQKTPARIVFELVEKTRFSKEDVFFDLGAGLGQVAILINLLKGVAAKGIEFEPAFCKYASTCAATLNLSNVAFINADAREADYTGGTVFFMFTPFKGAMLQEVLERLRREALQRKIKLVTYRPCTAVVARQSWLQNAAPENSNMYKLHFFNSR